MARAKAKEGRKNRSSMLIEELEPRILFSADGMVGLGGATQTLENSVLVDNAGLPSQVDTFAVAPPTVNQTISLPVTSDSFREIAANIELDAIERHAAESTLHANLVEQPRKQTALATITVNTTNDTPDAVEDGVAADAVGNVSLRAAIMHANQVGGEHTIILPSGDYHLMLPDNSAADDTGSIGDLDLNSDITIEGAGSGLTTISGASFDDRVFHSRGAVVSINGVTISGGGNVLRGGGIRVDAGSSLSMKDVIFNNNFADQGGAIFNGGTLKISDSLLLNNSSSNFGGAIYSAGVTELDRATVSGNGSTGEGGGIYSSADAGTDLDLNNVTISGNTASSNGGGIWIASSANIVNATITGNSAGDGGGVFHSTGAVAVSVFNTLIAENNASGSSSDVLGDFQSLGNNLIGDVGLVTDFSVVNNDQFGTTMTPLNPLIEASLNDNGGGTLTHELLDGSPAIDAGSGVDAPLVDQRNLTRDSQPDIGSFELNAGVEQHLVIVSTTSDDADTAPTSIADLNANPGADGLISLREAIIAANATTNASVPDEIRFDITETLDNGYHTITLSASGSALPLITDPVVIDGTSDSDYVDTPIIQLNGTGVAASGLELSVGSDGSTVRGLAINNFGSHGIEINSTGNFIQGNHIGVTNQGGNSLPNLGAGILISGSGNTIGGSGFANVIAFNNNSGVNLGGALAIENKISQNIIHSNSSAEIALNSGNESRSAPVLSVANVDATGRIRIEGSYSDAGTPSEPVQIEFFVNTSGKSEAGSYLGELTTNTGASGSSYFTTLRGSAVSPGMFVTATATDSAGNNTSQLSNAIEVLAVNTAPTMSSGLLDLGSTTSNTASEGVRVSDIVSNFSANDIDGDTLGIAIQSTFGNAVWQYSVDSTDGSNGNWTAFPIVSVGSSLLLASNSWVRYLPDNSGAEGTDPNLVLRIWDGSAGTASATGAPATASPGFGGGNSAFSSNTSQVHIAVTAANEAPAAIAAALDLDEGGALNLNGSSSSDIDGTIVSYEWDVNDDGSIEETGAIVSISWADLVSADVNDDDSYTVALTVTDNNGASHKDVTTFSVNNTAPEINITGPTTVHAGQAHSFTFSVTDPGEDTVTEWRIDWGDGNIQTVSGNEVSLSHTYAVGGLSHQLIASAMDEDGIWSSADLLISNAGFSPVQRYDAVSAAFEMDIGESFSLFDATGVTIGPDGLLYVVGDGSLNVERFNPLTGARINEFIADEGLLNNPAGITFGPDQNLYIVDSGSAEILRFDGSEGSFIDRFIPSGPLAGFAAGLQQPIQITFADDGLLYVSDSIANEILRFDAFTGAYVDTFVSALDNGGLQGAVGFTFGPDGNLYVASFGLLNAMTGNWTSTVLRFDGNDGSFMGPSAFVSAGDGGLAGPIGIQFSPSGDLLVVSRFTNSVLRYDGDSGAFIDEFVPSAANGLFSPNALLLRSEHLINVNHMPEATIQTINAISEGDSLLLDGTASSDSDGSVVSYAWDIGNNSVIDANGEAPELDWEQLALAGVVDDGLFDITLTVTDNEGGTHSTSTQFRVQNRAPDISVTGSSFADVNSEYTVSLAANDPGDDTVSQWRIDWGDGSVDTVTGNTASHVYTAGGYTHDIIVSAIDEDGTWLESDVFVSNDASSPLFRFDGQTQRLVARMSNSSDINPGAGLVVGPDGLVYVVGFDTRQVQRFDPTDNSFVDTFIPVDGAGNGNLTAIDFGPDGNLYLADASNHRILRFNAATGDFLNVFVESGAGGLVNPVHMSFETDGFLYVSSYDTDEVLRYHADTGEFESAFISNTNNGALDGPVGFQFGPDGNLYVASNLSNEVLRFEPQEGGALDGGEFIAAGAGGINVPLDLIFDAAGDLLVSSSGTDSIIRFDSIDATPSTSFVDTTLNGLDKPKILAITPDKQVTVKAFPTISEFSTEVKKTDEEVEVVISFAELLRASDASDIDGSIAGFLIQEVISGTLRIGSDSVSAQPFLHGSNNAITPGTQLYWTPADDFTGSVEAFEVKALDNESFASVMSVTASIQVAPVNDPPELDAVTIDLGTSQAIEPSVGVQVDSLLTGISIDVDNEPIGLAVTETQAGGRWQYSDDSTDGRDGIWTDIPLLDPASAPGSIEALLLGSDHWLRYVPQDNVDETSSLSFRAWDGTIGSPSTVGAPNILSITSASSDTFSSNTAVVQLLVQQVNSPASIELSAQLTVIAENSEIATPLRVSEISVTDDGVGVNELRLSGADADKFELIGSELFLRSDVQLDHEQLSELRVNVEVIDSTIQTSPVDSKEYVLAVDDVNEAPLLGVSTLVVNENTDSSGGIVVATIDVMDPDFNEQHNLTIAAGTDAALFSISEDNELILDDGILDFERQSRYEVLIEVRDSSGSIDTQLVEIELVDEDEISALIADAASEENFVQTSVDDSVTGTEQVTTAAVEEPAQASEESESDTENEPEESEQPAASESAATENLEEQFERDTMSGRSRADDGALEENRIGLDLSAAGLKNIVVQAGAVQQGAAANDDLAYVDVDQLILIDDELASFELAGSMFTSIGAFDQNESHSLLENSSFQQGLDTVRQSIIDQSTTEQIVIGSSVTVTTGVSIGYVLWLIRGSVLLSTVLSSLPAWRLIDPLPVLGGMLDSSNSEEDEESLETILEDAERSNAQQEIAVAGPDLNKT